MIFLQVRPISLSNVLATNAYIMIFEMEQPTQSQVQIQQAVKLNGTLTVNNTLPSPGSPMNRTISPKASTSGILTLNGSMNGSSAIKENNENSETNSQISVNKSTELQFSTQKITNFIGPQLPQKLKDKTQPRLIMHIKNGKILNENSLVPYDGSSEEEEVTFSETLKTKINSNTMLKTSVTPNGSNGIQKGSSVKTSSPKTVVITKDIQKSVPKANGSNISQTPINVTQCTKTQNGSTCSTVTSLKKYQNGQTEVNNKTESSSNKSKWHQSVRIKTGQDEKVITKATSSMKGWQVSKDTFSPASTAAPNGWSVTDK